MREKLKKYLFQLTLLMTACLVTGYVVLEIAQYYFSLYPYISVFFFLLGCATIFSIIKATKKESRKYFNVFMIIKIIKLFSIVLLLALYAMFVRENTISFIFTFFAYYLIYSIFEAYVSMKLNKDENEISQK
jgi:phosphatidylserine synthase